MDELFHIPWKLPFEVEVLLRLILASVAGAMDYQLRKNKIKAMMDVCYEMRLKSKKEIDEIAGLLDDTAYVKNYRIETNKRGYRDIK